MCRVANLHFLHCRRHGVFVLLLRGRDEFIECRIVESLCRLMSLIEKCISNIAVQAFFAPKNMAGVVVLL